MDAAVEYSRKSPSAHLCPIFFSRCCSLETHTQSSLTARVALAKQKQRDDDDDDVIEFYDEMILPATLVANN